MASTYTTGFGIEKIGTGEQAGAWGTTTNHNADIIDRLASYKAVALSGTTHTLTVREASPGSGTENLQDGMYRVIKFTGALGANNTVTIAPNTSPAWFIIENATTDSGSSGPYSVILTQGSGANVTVQTGKNAIIYCDGAGSGAVVYDALADLQVGTLEVTGAAAIDGVTTHGGNVVSDTDSTDDLGTTGVRWANLYVDAITASDQITATGFTGTLDGILGSGTAAAASVTTLTTSGIASIDDTTDSSSGTTGSIHTDGGLGVAKSIYANPNVDSTHVLGQLKIGYAFAGSASIAEHGNLSTTNFALNQTSGGQTIINSASGQTLLLAQNGTAIVTYSGGDATHTGAISVDDTTDSTSTTSGSIHTDGGLGVAKDIIAGAAVMVGGNIVTSRSNANGSIEVSHNSGTMETGTASGNADELIIVGAATGANSGMTILSGVAQTGNVFFGDNGDTDIGGITYNHNGNAMTFVTNATTQLTLSSAGLATFVGALSVDDTTDSTSTTTGSIHTDGGLGVAKKLYVAGGMNVTTTGSTSTFTVVNSSTLTVVGTGSSAATNSDLYIDTKGSGSIYLRPGGSTPSMTIAGDGAITKPLQPAFLAYPNAIANVTGNGTVYTVVWANEVYDQGSDFDGTSTFTAPVAGKYTITAMVEMTNLSATTNATLNIVTSNGTWTKRQIGSAAEQTTTHCVSLTINADMDAADTCTISTAFTGNGADTADISAGRFSQFSACLLA